MEMTSDLSHITDKLDREHARHYIPANEEDIAAMLDAAGAKSFADLFSHIPPDYLFEEAPDVPEELSYDDLKKAMEDLAAKNNRMVSFIGDGLPQLRQHAIVEFVLGLRKLTTSYTPYQPERSQGTLQAHWVYQCLMSNLLGFEAVNASLYDRSTAIFEAIAAATRIKRKTDTALVSEAIYPGDKEVLKTLVADTDLSIEYIPLNEKTGQTDVGKLKERAAALGDKLAAVVFPQVNSLGLVEDVDALTEAAQAAKALAVAVVDPALLAEGGLKPPSEFGPEGADIAVGEAQHLAISPNFGGPGLGFFAVRHNDKVKNAVRAAPGRFVGQAKDSAGRACKVIVLSTREQHIRKEKATSNICSNQAFLATLVGASLLAKGDKGLAESCKAARCHARHAAVVLTCLPGIELAFPETAFVNEVTVRLPGPASLLIQYARQRGLHLGVDVSDRVPGAHNNLLKLSFSDILESEDLKQLYDFINAAYRGKISVMEDDLPKVPDGLLRKSAVGIPNIAEEKIREWYTELAELNVSPDEGCYPLGSCTMKYNPRVNDWAASLPGFAEMHPQAPEGDVQGCLEVLFETQEWFKKITGLDGVVTQVVAGAQGELAAIKMFQAYHRDRGDAERDIILIPKSAHGTNFATATMAGFRTGKKDGRPTGVVLLESDEKGRIDLEDLDAKIADYGSHVSGIMVTNPNTGGIFENHFKEVAEKVRKAGGLVYMDGANMNAIAGWVNLGAMGVDAVHQNLHKTWSIPHGGGGPGDAVVAVSGRLLDYMPGKQVVYKDERYVAVVPKKTIGSMHRHWGNFAHKVRCLAYLRRLGRQGIRRMSAMAVLSSRYLFEKLKQEFPSLPERAVNTPRMHEFILTLTEEEFAKLEALGIPKVNVIPRVGKAFLDFGFHSPTVAFPEIFGLMIEPTESYTKAELDHFADAVLAIKRLIHEKPEVFLNTPYYTPIDRVDEVAANRDPVLSERLKGLPELHPNRASPKELLATSPSELLSRLVN